MRTIRTLLVDDEPLARSGLEILLRRHKDVEVVGECGNGFEAVEAIQRLEPDLVFLDVQMPGLDGFGVIETVGADAMPAVVFVTAFDEHAIHAFRVHAVDYLLKPVEAKLFREALDRARTRVRKDDEVARRLHSMLADHVRILDEARESPRPERYLRRILVKGSGRAYFLKVDRVDWIGAEDNYIALHEGGKTHLIRGTMNEIEERLDPQLFARIHRGTLVNLERVQEIRPYFKGDHVVVLTDGTELRVSRSYRDRILSDQG